MHQVPLDVNLPDEKTDNESSLPKPFILDRESSVNLILVLPLLENMPYVPPQPPPRASRNRNWLRLPASKEQEADESEKDKKEESVPSGWGWLADDVRTRTDRREAEKEAAESREQQADDGLPLSKQNRTEPDRAADGFLLRNLDQNARAAAVPQEVGERDLMQMIAKDPVSGSVATTRKEPAGSPQAPPRLSALESDQTSQELTGRWDSERPWGWNERRREETPSSLLPQTQALLSRQTARTREHSAVEPGSASLPSPAAVPAPESPVRLTDRDLTPFPSFDGARSSASSPGGAWPGLGNALTPSSVQSTRSVGPWESSAGNLFGQPAGNRAVAPSPSRGFEPSRLPAPTAGWGAGTVNPQASPWLQPQNSSP